MKIFKMADSKRKENNAVEVSPDKLLVADDVWLLVFSCFSTVADRVSAALVCRRWRELTSTSWQSVARLSYKDIDVIPSVRYTSRYLNVHILQVILRQCGKSLRHLNLSSFGFRRLPISLLDAVALRESSLQELDLTESSIVDDDLMALSERLPKLKCLSLMYCSSIENESALSHAFRHLRLLESLNVSGNRWIVGACFLQAPQSLTQMCTSSCCFLKDDGIRFLSERCPNLLSIDFSGCCCCLEGQSVNYLVKCCPKIKRLRCTVGSMQSAEYCLSSMCNLPLLEELHVGQCSEGRNVVTDQAVKDLSIHCPRIVGITLRDFDLPSAAYSHFRSWLHLESIDLGGSSITDTGLLQLCSFGSELKKVNLAGCQSKTDEGVGHLVSAHPNLLELDLSYCPQTTDEVLTLLKSSLERRQHTQPLRINLNYTSVTSEQVDTFMCNTGCVVLHGASIADSLLSTRDYYGDDDDFEDILDYIF